ncbi:MAG: 50S ribosomal protein L17 [Candidatus Marinimicrobia bacterium]|nr:50S ribosomal protein L17 [Candidatus Neomarinimicrobiota bacterium]|tara:strand:- start:14260 stop:14655 length:396 start_codon:yes stop_codon:yes gene_type:complete
MRHQKKINKIGRNASHRKATLANLASSLIEYKRIKTTHSKAKATQQFIEPLITKAKRGTLHDRRNVLKFISRPDIVGILFDEIGPKFKDRNGGYTRITKLGFRKNDAASISLIEFVLSSESNTKSDSSESN